MKKSDLKSGDPLKKEHKRMDEESVLEDPIEMVLQNENIRAMLKVSFHKLINNL